MKTFYEEVYDVVKKIPRGRVVTYKQVTRAIGRPGAARAVGNALNKSPGTPEVPCHRVVRSDGGVGGYAQGTKKKTDILLEEGVEIQRGKIVLRRFGFRF